MRWRESARHAWLLVTRRGRVSRPFGLWLFTLLVCSGRAEDGYRLWLRYDRVADTALRQSYAEGTHTIALALPSPADSSTLAAAREELTFALDGLVGVRPAIKIVQSSPSPALGNEGFTLRTT